MCRLNARLSPFQEEAFDAFVAETLDHRNYVSRNDTRVNSFGRRLRAYPSQNAKSLVETRLSDGLHISSLEVVAGARFALFRQCKYASGLNDPYRRLALFRPGDESVRAGTIPYRTDDNARIAYALRKRVVIPGKMQNLVFV